MGNKSPRKYWWIVAIVVPLSAALIGVLGPIIYDLLKTEGRTAEPIPSEEDLSYAERLTEDYIISVAHGDLDFIMYIVSAPFFFDNYLLSNSKEIQAHYEKWWEEEEVRGQEVPKYDVESFSVAQFKRKYPLYAFHDRVLKSPLKIEDTDIVVYLSIEGEGTLFFYRKFGNELKMIGFWG